MDRLEQLKNQRRELQSWKGLSSKKIPPPLRRGSLRRSRVPISRPPRQMKNDAKTTRKSPRRRPTSRPWTSGRQANKAKQAEAHKMFPTRTRSTSASRCGRRCLESHRRDASPRHRRGRRRPRAIDVAAGSTACPGGLLTARFRFSTVHSWLVSAQVDREGQEDGSRIKKQGGK